MDSVAIRQSSLPVISLWTGLELPLELAAARSVAEGHRVGQVVCKKSAVPLDASQAPQELRRRRPDRFARATIIRRANAGNIDQYAASRSHQ